MALAFRAVATANTGATPANTLTIALPAATGAGECMRCYLAVYGGGTTAEVDTPPGWGMVSRTQSATSGVVLYIFGRTATSSDPAAGWTWVFDSARSAAGAIVTYRDTTASTFARLCSGSAQANASSVTHFTPTGQTSNVANQWIVTVFAAASQDTWTLTAPTERADLTTTAGTNDVCICVGDLTLSGTGSISNQQGDLDSAVAAEGCTAVEVLTSNGLVQQGGGYSQIVMHDNTKSASGVSFNAAEIFYGFPHGFRKVGTQGSRICYEMVNPTPAQTVNITVGQASSPQTTTWADTLVNINTNLCAIQTNASNLSSWHFEWGTKVGSGDEAGGINGVHITSGAGSLTLRGHLKLYGCQIYASGPLTVANGAASLDGDVQGCVFDALGGLTIGSSTFSLANVYDVDIKSSATTTTNIVPLFFATKSKKIRMNCSTFRSFLGANTTGAFKTREISFVGTPTTADVRWGGTSVTQWYLVQPEWSGAATKFAIATSGNPSLANATLEYRTLDVKVVDSTGAGIANIPVTITDTVGNVQVTTTTTSTGEISFGSGQLANAVVVMDHYAVTTTYTQRHRSPFLLEVNTGNSRNTDYQSRRIRFNWPGYENITTSAGSFEDLNVIVALQDPSGSSTGWTEREQP